MSAKPEAKEAAPPAAEKPGAAKPGAAPDKSAPAGDKAVAVVDASSGGSKLPLFAALGAVILGPAISFAAAQFVLLPRLEKKFSAPLAPADAAAAAAPASGAEGDKKGKAPPPTYEFTNLVVNLAGTMGTRYLKTSFMVTGDDPTLTAQFTAHKAQLTDVTLNVLSALTLADLEEPGSKNVLREKLVGAYNQALGHRVADQVYFSDFVVQ